MNDDKIQQALSQIEVTRKTDLISRIKSNFNLIEVDVKADPIETVDSVFKGIQEISAELDKQTDSEDHQKLFKDLETMLKEAVAEHVKILLDNAKETVQEIENPSED